ncbi:tripartite tricarboxylate transporter substrate binding protein [Hydrogenophaga sp. UC242_53]|uniref:tripartite tricarboxylate transporter substrate binding protein n=1 Tax=Hydrogenophaga sp. UC242_53 TaxID=3350170 RepID=UPI0036D40DC9
MNSALHRTLAAAVAAALCATAGLALAQAPQPYPTKAVTMIVPFPPAGGADSLARILAVHLGNSWKQTVLVENRPGAAGHIGASYVARSAPDGYTLMMSSTASLTKENASQFAPVALVSASPYVVTVNPRLGVKNIRELGAKAKAEPGKLTFGSSGEGSASHLTVELFKQVADVEMMHVPYKGTGQAVNDLLAGTIDVMFAPGQTVMPHVKSGKLVALAVTSAKRAKATPELPTIADSGVPGYAAVGWFGLLAPAATPKAVIAKLGADVSRTLDDPAVERTMLEAGAEPAEGTPEQFGRFIQEELTKWGELEQAMARKAGAKPR